MNNPVNRFVKYENNFANSVRMWATGKSENISGAHANLSWGSHN